MNRQKPYSRAYYRAQIIDAPTKTAVEYRTDCVSDRYKKHRNTKEQQSLYGIRCINTANTIQYDVTRDRFRCLHNMAFALLIGNCLRPQGTRIDVGRRWTPVSALRVVLHPIPHLPFPACSFSRLLYGSCLAGFLARSFSALCQVPSCFGCPLAARMPKVGLPSGISAPGRKESLKK